MDMLAYWFGKLFCEHAIALSRVTNLASRNRRWRYFDARRLYENESNIDS
jgi:hypothetical protein